MSLLLPTQECKTVLALTLTSREASFKLPLARGVGSITTAAEMGGTKVDAIHLDGVKKKKERLAPGKKV